MTTANEPKIYYADGEFFGLTENINDHLRPIAFVEHKAYAKLRDAIKTIEWRLNDHSISGHEALCQIRKDVENALQK